MNLLGIVFVCNIKIALTLMRICCSTLGRVIDCGTGQTEPHACRPQHCLLELLVLRDLAGDAHVQIVPTDSSSTRRFIQICRIGRTESAL